MKGKILFVVGLGVGYVLGARAGRERYEQIRTAALNVWNQPAVQQGVGTVKDFAKTRVSDLSDTVLDGVKGLIGNATKGPGATTASGAKPSSGARSGGAKASAAKSTTAKSSSAKSGASESGTTKAGSASSSSSSGGSTAESGS
ncbi:YtxH domain-containing protein [Agromyces bauzanensis]|uniref:YtxH domain-containing protein n=1 Tax=Agromyces bauzanensis TaxID=1308924 RepID=A0A917UX53_9MICO|nr:YtxH domain-containing protein [Agromyces bauzanensis]GGJ92200.1 hypothetical protein GCM10011372_33340 [Agromyces bauzanensis]